MSKRQQGYNKRSVYSVFLISYITILLIAMTSSLIFYSKINDNINNQTKRSKIALLDQLMIDFENKVSTIHNTRDSIVFNRKLEMFAKGLSTYSYTELMNDLNGYKKPDFFVDYFVYLTNSDEIVTSNIRMQSQKFFDLIYAMDESTYVELKREMLEGYHMNEYLPSRQISIYDEEHTKVIPYVQSFPIGTNVQPVGQLIILLDTEKLGEFISKFSWATDSFIYVLDKNNGTILASETAPILPEELYKQLNQEGVIFDYKLGNEEVRILHKQSEKIGWKFISITPKHIYFEELNHFTIEAIGIIIIYLIGGIIIVHLFARKNYKPIKEIKDIISEKTESYNGLENEYEYIKQIMKSSFENDKVMRQRIRDQIPIIKNDCLLKLLKGYQLEEYDMDEWLKSVQVVFETNLFIVVNVEFDLKSAFFNVPGYHRQESMSIARFVMENRGREVFDENFESYFINLESNQSVWLLNLRNGIEQEEGALKAVEAMEVVTQFLDNQFEISAHIGMSSVQQSVMKIRECYDEAKKASEYGRIQGENQMIQFKELGDVSFDYYYPIDTEFQLTNLLKNGFYDESQKLINTLFDINFVSKKINAYAAKCLIYEISATFNKLLNSLRVMQGDTPVSNEGVLEVFTDNLSIEEAKETFTGMIYQIKEMSPEKAVGKTEKLVNSITEYILAAPEDVWLDLNSLSKEFDVTPQYISNSFKKYTNENIKDFISKNKLNTAKKMLVHTDLSTKEISTRLGYANEAGILRLFKKYEGITPGIYRANNKNVE